jgi:hypothetical protein
MSDAVISTLLDRYELLSTLGKGGHGAVHEARDQRTGERVALKELTHVSPAAIAQFKQEFRAVREVHHPNLVRLDALFEDQGKWVIAMELVEGKDLLDQLYVDGVERCFDEAQLRDAFLQLAEGLQALHDAGFVHRDVKPANVRVTDDGRVVLLDFGLALPVDAREQSIRAAGLGTAAYMAPEQATSHALGPAADWYAFGVCLYEAMTGVLPVDADTPLGLLTAKQRPLPMPASSYAGGIPPDLDALCGALLEVTAEARPSGRRIRSLLRRGSSAPSTPVPTGSLSPGFEPAFEGRGDELAQLERLFASANAGDLQVVLIEGDSGIGKTALVEHFLEGRRGALVFRSRCYENELLAYKAFDGAMEELARVLTALPSAEREALLPPNAALLCRLFPALAEVAELACVPLTGLAADPTVQRLEAFAIFVRLLTRLGERAPFVFVIDDLQWADAESFRLLETWLGSAPTRCLIIATVRPKAELLEAAEPIAALRKRSCVHELALSGLPHASAMRLCRALVAPGIPEAWLAVIVEESAGHPLFLTVLLRFAESHDPKSEGALTLDVAIEARLGGLSRNARRLLETVALAGSPLAAPLCGRAAGLGEVELGRLATELCRQKLMRRRRAGEISCFHDRIRRVTVESVPAALARELHGELAVALAAQGGADPAELARHYEAAGELALACEVYQQGARKAISGLAFARAAMLYQRAIKLAVTLGLPAAERTALQIACGHALAQSGRSAEAAQLYLETSAISQGEQRTQLRIWAAQHLLQSAHMEEGMAAARALLQELDVPLPTRTASIVGRLLWDRAYLGICGLQMKAAPEAMTVQTRMQLDALWGLALPVAWLDPLASTVLITRHLRLSRSVDAPVHMARALAEEAFARALLNPNSSEADALIARARALCQTSNDPALEVSVLFREATVAALRFEQARACELLERAQRIGIETCPDQPWLLTNVRINLGNSWSIMGEHARLRASTAAWLDDARDRNDQFALSLIGTFGGGHIRHLMADDTAGARAALEQAMAPWPREPFSFARLGELIAAQQIELYEGGASAHVWLEREHARLSRAFALKTPPGKTLWLKWRGLASLAAHRIVGGEALSVGLLREAARCARGLERIDLTLAKVSALALRAQLAAIEGGREDALAKSRSAREYSARVGYHFLAHATAYFEGLLEGGPAGLERRRSALEFFAGQGWKNPTRAIALLYPAIGNFDPPGA